MQLLGLAWANAGSDVMRNVGRGLLKEQREDGGWGQLPGLESDAYATGEAMVALKMSGMLADADVSWQRAQGFLLRTQLEDGSWLVRSRTVPFQTYKESGFPHGKNQWISATGTSWAVWALSLTDAVETQAAVPVTKASAGC
jgi:N-acyl-D-amino-acid deacylase